ncbi:universal stress protein [Halocatena marina]|uniref:Universal stress protein n=1 Tax=Halocatena marina TaxID=2934937 RepID=A0ABD5YQ67_9EURY|nr:universal stress protein [Halocatena marina]
MYDTVLVPVDGSNSANRAVERALGIAQKFDATVHTIFVVDTTRYGESTLSSSDLVLNDLETHGASLLEEVVDSGDDMGIEIVQQIRHGAPHQEIITYADEIGADAIVLGYQGQSHELAGHIGSVADRVVRTAGRPVMIV